MNTNIYYYETIEECEKEIIDKSTMIDMMYASNMSLFQCFTRIVRTIMIWASFIIMIVSFVTRGFKPSIKTLGIIIAVFVIYSLLISWVNHNYLESYSRVKINLVNNIIEKCKEYDEADYEEWQKKQIFKRFLELARIE